MNWCIVLPHEHLARVGTNITQFGLHSIKVSKICLCLYHSYLIHCLPKTPISLPVE
jgi:hypothetical protein